MPILIVDDDQAAAETQAIILRRHGYSVLTCTDGADALGLIEQHRPRVLLLDLILPGVDGFDVVQELKENPDLRPKLVIAVTGYGDVDTREQTAAAGFDYHLVKPVKLAELLEILETVFPSAE
jgi:CheY-like chemotaxis protein